MKQITHVAIAKTYTSMKEGDVKNENQMKSSFFCSHGASNARGVTILIRNNFDCLVEELVADTQGRFLILKVNFRRTSFLG